MKLEEKARQIIENECDDYFLGFGDLQNTDDPMIQGYNKLFDDYPTSISIGITLPFYNEYSTNPEIYNRTNCQLKTITMKICDLLEDEGYSSFSFPKSDETNETYLSLHVIAANHANLGEIGENGLLTTPEVGSSVNWGTVLTDAPIKINTL
jgi:epoxyqueuosine reductase QueG